MKKNYFFFSAIMIGLCMASCNTNKEDNSKNTVAGFDLQKARAFIDSINTKWVEQLKTGDSVTIASHYAPDGKILVTNGEPISSDGILAAWGAMIRGGLRDWKFVTTDLAGDSNFLIETGTYEINGADKKLVDKGNYVVTWKMQPNGEWKLYRDVGVSSMPVSSK